MVRQFEERVTSLVAGGCEAGGDFVSDCMQGFAVAAPQFSQDHARTELTFGVVVRGGDVGGVREQEPLVVVMSQVFRQALDVRVPLVTRGGSSPLVEVPFDVRALARVIWTRPIRRDERPCSARSSAA
jgi:hypothetical protein